MNYRKNFKTRQVLTLLKITFTELTGTHRNHQPIFRNIEFTSKMLNSLKYIKKRYLSLKTHSLWKNKITIQTYLLMKTSTP